MTGLLTAIDGELDAAVRRVEQLRQMRALALSLDGAGEGVALGEPSPPAAGGAPPRAAEDGTSGARVEAGPPIPGRNGADAPASAPRSPMKPSAVRRASGGAVIMQLARMAA